MVTMRGWNVTRQRVLWFAGQAALVLFGVYVYFRIRNLTEGNEHAAQQHAEDVVELQERLSLNVEDELQVPVRTSDALEAFANWVYIWGHWPVIVATMAWLAWRHRDVFRRLRDGMMISGAIGMVIFALYPVAPPRLAGLGLVDTVTESSQSYRVLQPPGFTNQYAAMPSLHIGWDLLVGIAIVTAGSTVLVRAIGYAMPVLMGWAVVATANHYVLDVIAGVSLVLVAHWLALRLERRRHRRQAAEAERAAEAWREETQSRTTPAGADGPPCLREPALPHADGLPIPRQQHAAHPPSGRARPEQGADVRPDATPTALPRTDDGQRAAPSHRSSIGTPAGHRPPCW